MGHSWEPSPGGLAGGVVSPVAVVAGAAGCSEVGGVECSGVVDLEGDDVVDGGCGAGAAWSADLAAVAVSGEDELAGALPGSAFAPSALVGCEVAVGHRRGA